MNSSRRKIFRIGIFLGILVLVFWSGAIFGKNSQVSSYFADVRSAISGAFGETFGFLGEEPVFEIDLAAPDRDLAGLEVAEENESAKRDNSPDKKSGGLANVSQFSGSFEGDRSAEVSPKQKSGDDKRESSSLALDDHNEGGLVSSNELGATLCDFYAGGSPSRDVLFSEIAWMGSDFSANDEWIELFNNSLRSVNLSGWKILSEGEKIEIVFESGGIPERSFYTLERTDDDSVPNSPADKIYVGALSNSGEWLKIFDEQCHLVDEVDGRGGWRSLGGDHKTKRTLERNLANLSWQTSEFINGTPKKVNSGGLAVVNDLPLPPEPPPPPSDNTQDEPPPPPPPEDESVARESKIFITEIMAGSSVSSGDEFVEIYNYGSGPVDLTGWTLKKKSSTGSESTLVAASRLEGKIIPAGKYFLLAHEEGYMGAVAPDVWWPKSYTLAYTNNAIVVYNSDGGVVEEVAWAEISKDSSYARDSLTENSGFSVQNSPNPQNSQ